MSLLPDRADKPIPSEMDLQTSRKILEGIVTFPENLITDNTDLNRIAGIDGLVARKALQSVASHLISEFKGSYWMPDAISKPTALGECRLLLSKRGDQVNLLELLIHRQGNFIIKSQVGMRDDYELSNQFGLLDYRRAFNEYVRVFDLGLSLERYRNGWRGIRWISANMLNWQGGVILPEDLDRITPNLPQLGSSRDNVIEGTK